MKLILNSLIKFYAAPYDCELYGVVIGHDKFGRPIVNGFLEKECIHSWHRYTINEKDIKQIFGLKM